MFFCFVLSQYVTQFLTMLVTINVNYYLTFFLGVSPLQNTRNTLTFFFLEGWGWGGGGVADMHVMDGLLVGFRTLRLQADSIFRYIL